MFSLQNCAVIARRRARSACPLLDRSHFGDILCIFIEICCSILCSCTAPPRPPLPFLKALRWVVRPGAQQAGWRQEPSFSFILQGFCSPGVMRNRSGSDLEGVGGRMADMEGLDQSRAHFPISYDRIICVSLVLMVNFELSRPQHSARQGNIVVTGHHIRSN